MASSARLATGESEQDNFNWLRRAERGPTYTSYSQFSHLPYCAFDWGENGYAGCSNHGGELLYLSAPSKTEGLIMARGHFATSLYASMSRSQIDFGGPSTFGLEVSRCDYAYDPDGKYITQDGEQEEEVVAGRKEAGAKQVETGPTSATSQDTLARPDEAATPVVSTTNTNHGVVRKKKDMKLANKNVLGASNGSSFRLGSMIDRGCFNYRWPVTEYYLELHPNHVAVKQEEEQRAKKEEQNGISKTAQGLHEGYGPTKSPIAAVTQNEEKLMDGQNEKIGATAKTGAKEKIYEKYRPSPSPGKRVGTCQMFSCSKGKMFYQVLRVEELRPRGDKKQSELSFPEDSQIVLTMGGPVWFQSFNDGDHGLTLGVGVNLGRVQTWEGTEPQNAGDEQEAVIDVSREDATKHTRTIRYWENKKGGRGLEARVYRLLSNGEYKQLLMTKSEAEADNGPVEGRTKLTAYNAAAKLEKLPRALSRSRNRTPRSATFLAAVRLFEGGRKGGGKWPKLPSSKDLYNHIGVDPSRGWATGAMWKGIFLDRGSGSEPILDLAEFNMIGRSLEKILEVDYTPVTINDDDEENNVSIREGKTIHKADPASTGNEANTTNEADASNAANTNTEGDTVNEHNDADDKSEDGEASEDSEDESVGLKYAALVSNLFVRQNIDLKSLFWKIRFLIKTHKFLLSLQDPSSRQDSSGEDSDPDTEDEESEMKRLQKFQMQRIQTQVENVIRYLVKVMLEPSMKDQVRTPMLPDHYIAGESKYYYVMMTIWYVWNYFKDLPVPGKDAYIPGKDASGYTFDWTGQLKLLDQPLKTLTLFDANRLPPDNWTFAASAEERVQLLQWYHYGSLLKLCEEGVFPRSWKDNNLPRKVARLAKAAKIVSSTKLSSQEPYVADDEIFDRLSFVSDELGLEDLGSQKIGTVESLSLKRVKQRDFTRNLNPGWFPPGVEESTSGPWEIHALCHHSSLVVLTKEEKGEQDWRTKEHTFAEGEILRQRINTFMNGEATLIPCWERAHASARKGWLRSEATAVVASTLVTILEKTMQEALQASKVTPDIDRVLTSDSTFTPERSPIDGPWSTEHYIKEVAQVALEQIKHARQDQKKLLQEVQHMEGLSKSQLEAFELFTNESGLLPPIPWQSFRPPLRYHPVNFFNSLEDTPELYKPEAISKMIIPVSIRNYKGRLDRPEENHSVHKEDPKGFDKSDIDEIAPSGRLFVFDMKATRKDEDDEGLILEIKKFKYNGSEESKEALAWALYDNLVDQEVQHRFYIVNPLPEPGEPAHIPKKILELLVYVLHPFAAPCLGDHILNIFNFSRFSCQTGDTWVASITLRSWRVCPEEKERENYDENAPAGDFGLPRSLRHVWEEKVKNLEVNGKTIWKPEVASVILSTNSFGDFSKCTVVAEFIGDEKMHELVKDARKRWQKFIHQPQTARCLVFFLLLGKMCQEITKHYEDSIAALLAVLKLDSTFRNTEDEYPSEFELGVWSLDALYKLQNSLNATVSSLLQAKQELMTQIVAGPGKRGLKLEIMCQEYLGQFENKLVQLTAVNVTLNRTIELNTRNKDAISAVLAMRDSRTAISQNSTVQKLTYLTIGYLPLALMAAIFAIPDTMNVLAVNMKNNGLRWFIVAIVALSLATWLLAIFIGDILNFLYPPPQAGGRRRWKNPPNLWKWLVAFKKWVVDVIKENKHRLWAKPEKKKEEKVESLRGVVVDLAPQSQDSLSSVLRRRGSPM